MSKNAIAFLSFLLILAAIFWSLFSERPTTSIEQDSDLKSFSVSRAFNHIAVIGQEPHFIGTEAHAEVLAYLVQELEDLGLEVEVQEGWTLSNRGTLTKAKNILARKPSSVEGTGDQSTLLLLSHYDSAVHSSPGASDAASGVATILEGVRAFIAAETDHSNDILIVFTDAEEVGLNGASLLLEHPWAQEIGLALNFEARGSGGSSFMILETNHGNENLIAEFEQAGVQYPVANSLVYSIYKLLPNDTDLTVMREQGDINGFNFAFIDNHFDYHTATDTPENLELRTLAHQGSYLMPLLNHFGNLPLDNLNSAEDSIYFNIPLLKLIHYPAAWSWQLLLIAGFLFFLLLYYALLKKVFFPRDLVKGVTPFAISLLVTGGFSLVMWQLCLLLYPHYREMEHGFTYNGYEYIWAFVFAAAGISFHVYSRFKKSVSPASAFIIPLFIWLLISALAVFFLEGASYFILLVYLGLIQFLLLIKKHKPNLLVMSFLSIPAIFLLMPLIISLPVAMGLNSLFVSAVLSVLLWTLLWPVLGFYRKKQYLGTICLVGFLLFFFIAHTKSEFNQDRPKPNSLVYLQDLGTGASTWNTYDMSLDTWTSNFFSNGKSPEEVSVDFSNKYNSGFSRSVSAPFIELKGAEINVELISEDSLGLAHYHGEIVPQRAVNRMELFTKGMVDFESFEVNGQTAGSLFADESKNVFTNRWSDRLLTYYVTGQDTLRFEFSLQKNVLPHLELYEASYDLIKNEKLKVPEREDWMIPRPFVLTDAIVTRQLIELPGPTVLSEEAEDQITE